MYTIIYVLSFTVQESPPLPRGQSRIGGSIEWARSLLNRIQGPMDTFRDNDALMKTPVSYTCSNACVIWHCCNGWLNVNKYMYM